MTPGFIKAMFDRQKAFEDEKVAEAERMLLHCDHEVDYASGAVQSRPPRCRHCLGSLAFNGMTDSWERIK